MNIQEALDIMNSDFKLWERAESTDEEGGAVTKTLNLPWGIGEVSVRMEGMTDAQKRREAVGSFGTYIRGLIDDATSDEAVTARAQQAAARSEQDDSSGSVIIGGESRVRDTSVQETTDAEAGETYEANAESDGGLREDLSATRAALKDQIGRAETDLARWNRELRGIDAALSVWDDEGGQ